MVWDRNGYCRIWKRLLHHDVAAPPMHLYRKVFYPLANSGYTILPKML